MRVLIAATLISACAVPAFADQASDKLRECAPQTLDAAVTCLQLHLPQKDKQALLAKDGLVRAHFGLGMWMRNEWELWSGGRLAQSLRAAGATNPDDMSGAILSAYVARERDPTNGSAPTPAPQPEAQR